MMILLTLLVALYSFGFIAMLLVVTMESKLTAVSSFMCLITALIWPYFAFIYLKDLALNSWYA
jgi:hypothetical protein